MPSSSPAPILHGRVEQQLVLLARSGRLKQKITDEQLKSILQQLQPAKKDFRITRKG